MVNSTETTQLVTQPKIDLVLKPSLKRWFKHLIFLPVTKRYFNLQDQQAIAQAVTRAEHGHIGEIQVVIEAYIPASQAYYYDTFLRAKQLFAETGVWDTECNSGILLYLNLCERKVEILVDRGLKKATSQETWEKICQRMVKLLAKQYYREALINGVGEIGIVLQEFYKNNDTVEKNELDNFPIILR